MKRMKVAKEGPMYIHNHYRTSRVICACMFLYLANYQPGGWIYIVLECTGTALPTLYSSPSGGGLVGLQPYTVPTAFEISNIVVIIHWTLQGNFNFLHHSQILQCLKTISKCKSMHAGLCTLHFHACTYCSILWVYIRPSWTTFIFFIIHKFCTV